VEKGRIVFLPIVDLTTGLSSDARTVRPSGVREIVMAAARTAKRALKKCIQLTPIDIAWCDTIDEYQTSCFKFISIRLMLEFCANSYILSRALVLILDAG